MYILRDIPIGKILRTLRMNKKWTQPDIVTKVQLHGSKMSLSTYSKIECGLANIKASDLVILKHVFDTTYEILFGEAEFSDILNPIQSYF